MRTRILATPAASTAHLTHLAGLIRVHWLRIGSRWRRLTPAGQALPALTRLRAGETPARLAAWSGVGATTA